MRWVVEAADARTGTETEISVEALTEAEAERVARYNGLLVSRVRKAVSPAGVVMPYAGPVLVAPAVLPPGRGGTWARLERRARATRVLGVVVAILGWVLLAGGVGVFVVVVVLGARQGPGLWREWLPQAAGRAWPLMVVGAASVVAASVLRLLAAMGSVMSAGAGEADQPDKVAKS